MHNWSLVCFTLLTQGAVGMVWLTVLGRWFGSAGSTAPPLWPLLISLLMTGLALYAALSHLAKPKLAPNALRNLAVSWLSREVVLVQVFAGILAILIILVMLELPGGLWFWEALACLAGLAALYAMTRVYLLRTVPVWNTTATPLEFAGSALLLGGALAGAVWGLSGVFEYQAGSGVTAAGLGLALGLLLKAAAIAPALAAGQKADAETWYAAPDGSLDPGRLLGIRMGLNLAGLALFLSAMISSELDWLWAFAALCCLAASEILGRWQFYGMYKRVGL